MQLPVKRSLQASLRADLSRQDDNDSIHQSSWYASKSSNRSRGIFWRFQCVMTALNPHDIDDDPQIELFTSDWWVSTRMCLSRVCRHFLLQRLSLQRGKKMDSKVTWGEWLYYKFPKVLAAPEPIFSDWPRGPLSAANFRREKQNK